MKIVKTYEAFINESIDLGPIDLIKKNYTEYEVKSLFDEELKDWISEDELENGKLTNGIEIGTGWEDTLDWFYDSHREEAKTKEVVAEKERINSEISKRVADNIISWYEEVESEKLSELESEKLSEEIIKAYSEILTKTSEDSEDIEEVEK
jgi:hypothetical protein